MTTFVDWSKWGALSGDEKAKRVTKLHKMACSWSSVIFPTERHKAIINCTADNVTTEEVMRVIALCRMNGYSELEVGAIRIHYDDLIDDTEKKIRKELGLEDDYTHTVRYLSAHDYQRVHQWYIDYIPKSYWCLLYAPNHAPKNKVCIRNAIKWLEEAGFIKEKYVDYLCKNNPPKCTLEKARAMFQALMEE